MQDNSSAKSVYDTVDVNDILTRYLALKNAGNKEEARKVIKELPIPSYLSAASIMVHGYDYYKEEGFKLEKDIIG